MLLFLYLYFKRNKFGSNTFLKIKYYLRVIVLYSNKEMLSFQLSEISKKNYC